MWGSAQHSEHEVLFAVGSKAYPGRAYYFLVNDSNEVLFIAEGDHKELMGKCVDDKDVVPLVIKLLKEWFPAKGTDSN